MSELFLSVNGTTHGVDVAPDTPLLWVLRGPVGDQSPKYGCGSEQCGSCRVLVDGRPRFACRLPVAEAAEHDVVTLQGLADDPAATVVIEALLARNAGQCGYCLPGIVVTLTHILRLGDRLDRAELALALDDHLCRCGSQPRILTAAVEAMERWHDER